LMQHSPLGRGFCELAKGGKGDVFANHKFIP